MFNPYDIAAAAGNLAINLADYLRRQLLPSAPNTEPVGVPFTPPFTGGQCEGNLYTVVAQASFGTQVRYFNRGNSTGFPDLQTIVNQADGQQGFLGAISGFTVTENASTWFVNVQPNRGVIAITKNIFPQPASTRESVKITLVKNRTNPADTCGNIPNPNSTPPVSSDGLASSTPPNIANDDDIVLGAPLVTIPPVGGALAAVVAALAAVANALDAARLLGDALKTIGDTLDKIKDWLDDKDKNDDTKKDLFRHDYGSIRKDGFLRLYPSGEVEGFKPVYIDLQLLSIPIGYGKYFGSLSPNFYRFKSLGHISFVSPSFGILETHEIEFSRTSLNVPENAYGFFYHLGLEDVIRANVSLFYLKSVT